MAVQGCVAVQGGPRIASDTASVVAWERARPARGAGQGGASHSSGGAQVALPLGGGQATLVDINRHSPRLSER